jgi:acetyl-CoA acetyltransferase
VALAGATAIVGVGETAFYKRGMSSPRTTMELAFEAILAAVDDAGLTMDDVDGLAQYSDINRLDVAAVAQMLGIRQLRFAAAPSGGGGGSAGAIALAAMAVHSGMAKVVVMFHCVQFRRISGPAAFDGTIGSRATSWHAFVRSAGLLAPGPMFAMITRRHMHEFGTQRQSFGEVAITQRANALRLDSSLMRTPLTMDQYLTAPMITDPFCLYDYCLQSDGAVACVVTSTERARDLRRPPVVIAGAAMGGAGAWGEGEESLQMPDDLFTTSGYATLARELYASSGLRPKDVDVAQFYDHFSAMVLLQLEDFGLAPRGESGAFVESGGIRWPSGRVPVNTHGGSLSHANVNGATHIAEAARQIRGDAVNQVANARVALCTGAPGKITLSAILLRRDS